mmetsp:Transcript_37152/g.72971  ORF Transcript_37152/g.72971 Transcript_37152/m.72971 type:complete len:200 (+) Transcript_37152:30-629(+)|eukprot:CAMPEP_0175175550 /NCGR_PEP_ID=MMETSP0087-20121206/33269_1 /TAXON_ID=136419 /ORGANISM="Unknown Unknown, Strain D1" /LENGTH=199 /DNA_ID=CAMNT_0016467181 /DNA_START=17 /DNA_END=616 /DNA_ORIENTATION=-
MSDDDLDLDALIGELDDVIDNKKSDNKSSQLSKFKGGTSGSKVSAPPSSATKSSKSSSSSSGAANSDDDLDGLISELDTVVVADNKKKVNIVKVEGAEVGVNRCFPIFLLPANSSKSTCKSIHCLSCDHRVISIKNKQWNNKCNYLFFRNHTPNVQKLSANLVPSKGTNAYCCQCSWRSVDKEESLATLSDLRWVCAGC